MQPNMEVKLGKLKLTNPILSASGTVGHGDELKIIDSSDFFSDIGAFVTKGITLNPKDGNKPIRLIETNYGLINAIGLQNNGVHVFFNTELPKLLTYGIPVIINISAESIDEFEELAIQIKEKDPHLFQGVEINVSCPNIKKGGMAFGTEPKIVKEIVIRVKKHLNNKLIITKLTPNVTDITKIAKAAIDGGTDALSMINTVKGMAIDIRMRKPLLDNKTGGLSGPAIKPIGVRAVYECYSSINECKNKDIPIIGIGGIMSWEDAIEYMMAGASAVGIGTALYYSFDIFKDVKSGISKYMEKEGFETIAEIVGKAHEKNRNTP
ncbi:MAG: dihydroorotate dehydrogenase [Candidatus Thermoplasmatota archaeon]|nr:dihydroorotate dehydrogenase [Candidatus Thermoplasmatota archaeon]MBU4592188.1 dihydroorotate dehydrogenase [Candidatus Thermoplasmatota archaeon]